MYDFLLGILWYVILIDLLALAVLVLFLINARINMTRRISAIRFYQRTVEVSKMANTSLEAAGKLGMDVDAYTTYARQKNIDTPEARNERLERLEHERQEQDKRILEEEARWRADQERLVEEQRKAKETEMRERKGDLRGSGLE